MTYYINKRVFVDELVPGLLIGKAVLTDEGKVVLSEGTVLTPSLIDRLRQWGILSVFIRKEVGAEPVMEETPASIAQQTFIDCYEEIIPKLRKAFETMRYFKDVPVDILKECADTSIDALVEIPGALNHLYLVKRRDDYTYRHSLNVALITGLLGRWRGYFRQEIKNLILAGLLHDLGKTQVPIEILNKPGKLLTNEMDVMKKHTTRGYNLIKERQDLPPGVAYAILQHHERIDGSGYPLGVEGEKIHPYAKIVAVADIFDAMTTDRCYKNSATPFEVVQTLVQEMFNKLDPEICTVFLNNVRDYFVGNRVELSDGRTAEVLYIAQFVGARPVVRTTDGEFIDLEKRKDITITSVVKA